VPTGKIVRAELTGAAKIGGMSEQYGPPEPHVPEPNPAEGAPSGAYGTEPPDGEFGFATEPPYPGFGSEAEPSYEASEAEPPHQEPPYQEPPRQESPYQGPSYERSDPATTPPYDVSGLASESSHRGAGPAMEPPHPVPGPATPPPSRSAAHAQARPVVPRGLSRLPYAFVLCGVGAGLAVVATNHFRRGSMLIAAAVFIGALARLLLPESQVGMLAVRRRWLDVFLMTTAAVGITLVAFVAKGTTG
jgi:hypothetical protein